MRHARINGTVRVLVETRLILPRINRPIKAWREVSCARSMIVCASAK